MLALAFLCAGIFRICTAIERGGCRAGTHDLVVVDDSVRWSRTDGHVCFQAIIRWKSNDGYLFFEPADLTRISMLMQLDAAALMGYTGALFHIFSAPPWVF